MPPKARNRTGECRIKSGSAFFETGDFENQSGGMANADGTALESPPPTTIDEKSQHKCIILDCFDKIHIANLFATQVVSQCHQWNIYYYGQQNRAECNNSGFPSQNLCRTFWC